MGRLQEFIEAYKAYLNLQMGYESDPSTFEMEYMAALSRYQQLERPLVWGLVMIQRMESDEWNILPTQCRFIEVENAHSSYGEPQPEIDSVEACQELCLASQE